MQRLFLTFFCLLIALVGEKAAAEPASSLMVGGDPFYTLQQLEAAAAVTAEGEARDSLKLQAALLARILGARATAERLLKTPTSPELSLLKFFDEDRGAPPPLPDLARYDALSRRVLEQWLGKSLSCWNNAVDPLLCPGLR